MTNYINIFGILFAKFLAFLGFARYNETPKKYTNGVKQVIVIRRDLKMRRGKECAQASHAAMLWMVERWQRLGSNLIFTPEEREWLTGKFTKVCCQVDSEQELLEIYGKAKTAKLLAYLVTDSGATEFDGVPTKTCIAIGPNDVEEINKVTGNLKLY